MKDEEGSLRLAAGRNSKGEPLLDDKTISHSILDEAVKSNSEFRDYRHQPVARSGRPAEYRGLRSAHRDLHALAQAAGANRSRDATAMPAEAGRGDGCAVSWTRASPRATSRV